MQRQDSEECPESPQSQLWLNNSQKSYEELRLATNDFKTKLGKGGDGQVYYGVNPHDPTDKWAVKELFDGADDVKKFRTEVSTMLGQKHCNIVELKYFCCEGRNRMLVYEFMARGSLAKVIRGSPPPTFLQRLQLAAEIASGLSHIHRSLKSFHRDIKSDNILVSEDWEAKIADFGNLKSNTQQVSTSAHIVSNQMYTKGYLAPECFLNYSEFQDFSHNWKSEIFSLGVVLLELWTGRPALTINNATGELFALHDVVHDTPGFKSFRDPNIKFKSEWEADVAEDFFNLGLKCTSRDPIDRPKDMNDVYVDLNFLSRRARGENVSGVLSGRQGSEHSGNFRGSNLGVGVQGSKLRWKSLPIPPSTPHSQMAFWNSHSTTPVEGNVIGAGVELRGGGVLYGPRGYTSKGAVGGVGGSAEGSGGESHRMKFEGLYTGSEYMRSEGVDEKMCEELASWVAMGGWDDLRDEAGCVEWYEMEVGMKRMGAAAGLARLYIQRGKRLGGLEQAKHYESAIELLEMAKKEGSTCARNILGGCYKVGVGVPIDKRQAMVLWKESADMGDAHAPKLMGDWFVSLDGGHEWERGAKYYQIAMGRRTNVGAMFNLGCLYAVGKPGVEKNVGKARELLESANKYGHKRAVEELKKLSHKKFGKLW